MTQIDRVLVTFMVLLLSGTIITCQWLEKRPDMLKVQVEKEKVDVTRSLLDHLDAASSPSTIQPGMHVDRPFNL